MDTYSLVPVRPLCFNIVVCTTVATSFVFRGEHGCKHFLFVQFSIQFLFNLRIKLQFEEQTSTAYYVFEGLTQLRHALEVGHFRLYLTIQHLFCTQKWFTQRILLIISLDQCSQLEL